MWMILAVLLNVALAVQPGASIGVAGVRGSDGLHRGQAAGSLWVQQAVSAEAWFVEFEVLASGRSDSLPGSSIETVWVRPAGMIVWKGGTSRAQVHGALGPSVTIIGGGPNTDQLWVGQGIRGRWGVEISNPQGRSLGAALGGALRGRGGDVDLTIRMGWEL